MKNGKTLNCATISDVHFLHPRVKTPRVIQSVNLIFPRNAETMALDVIIISGDLCDRIITLPDSEAQAFIIWADGFLSMCAEFNISIWMVHGTKSHDRGQPRILVTLNDLRTNPADLRYVDTISVVYEEKFDCHVLYLPDDMNSDPDVSLQECRDAIANAGIEKADIGVTHGFFDFQVPSHYGLTSHDSAAYLDMVKHYIFNGHDHTHKIFDRICVPSSVERQSHNNEAPKGHVRSTIYLGDDPNQDTLEFIENTNAMFFKIVDISGMDTEEAIAHLSPIAEGRAEGYIRIDGLNVLSLSGLVSLMSDKYPCITWTKEVIKPKKEAPKIGAVLGKRESIVFSNIVTPKAIEEGLKSVVSENQDMCPETTRVATEIIEGIFND